MNNRFLIFCLSLVSCLFITNSAYAKVKELTSSYGIKFWYQQDTSAPIINIAFAFKNTGSAHMDLSKKVLPDLYTNTVLCGCKKYSKEELQEQLANISVSLYGKANADYILFFFRYAKIVSTEAIDLLKEIFSSPTFPKHHIERQKQILFYYFDNYQDNPSNWVLHIVLPQVLFNGYPYGESKGTIENLFKLTSDNLEEFHKQYIVRDNIELCVFGDISETEAIKLVDNILQTFSKGQKADDKIADVTPTFKNITRNHYINSPQSYIFFALPNILKNKKEKSAASILYLILGGSDTRSHIMKQLRDESGLIYSGGAFRISLLHSCFELGVTTTSNQNKTIVIQKIRQIIKQLQETGISEQELSFAKNNIKGTILVNLRTAADLCSFYIDRKLAGYSTNVLEETLQHINEVSLNEVNALAKKILNENNFPIIILGGEE